MLKGHVFKEQKFGNQIFALFINTFLDGKNGIHNDYKNSMAVTYSGSNVTVDSGVVCIQGRFLEEETSTTINAGTDALYCKLVIEIDLSKINTANDLNQACYKLVTDVNTYPALTQNNIVKNNTGIYQYELARFRTTSSGILEFQDMRTYLDFDSIYEEIRQHIQDIDDESIFVLKSDMAYSTTEKVVGTWIDGKPIYRKTFKADSMPDRRIEIDISGLNVDSIFFILDKSYLCWRQGAALPRRWAPIIQTCVSHGDGVEPNPPFYQSEIYTNYTNTALTINCGRYMEVLQWAITIEYTKTTD